MLSQTTSTERKADITKKGRPPKSSGHLDFCRASSFAIRLGDLVKTSFISAENMFRRSYTGQNYNEGIL